MTLTDSTLTTLLSLLDKEPEDRHLLLLIADRYDELEWGSGTGWRVLVATDRLVWWWWGDDHIGWRRSDNQYKTKDGREALPFDWMSKLSHRPAPCHSSQWVWSISPSCELRYATAYAEAADAVLRLPAERQAALLRGEL